VGYISPTIVKVWVPEKNIVKTVNDAVINESFQAPISSPTPGQVKLADQASLSPKSIDQQHLYGADNDPRSPCVTCKSICICQVNINHNKSTPKSFNAATEGPKSAQGYAAMQAEIDLLNQKNY
jgi:hypothetical protein